MSRTGRKTRQLVADKRYSSTAKPSKKPTTKGSKRRRRSATPQKRRGPLGLLGAFLRAILRIIVRIFATLTTITAVLIGGAVLVLHQGLPEVDTLLDGRAQGSVTLMDRDGSPFALRGAQYGGAVRASSVSPHLVNAVVDTEDRRFYRHIGVDPRGVASAVRINMREGRGPLSGHGGSTITQQTAKLLCLGLAYNPEDWANEAAYVADCRRTTLARKGREALFALAMELKYSKDEILSIYLNRAYMGGGAYGAAAAAELYFGKDASKLNPAEAAMLAGLLTAPSRLAPTSNLERSQDRAATVLRLMERQGHLTEVERETWTRNPATLAKDVQVDVAGYFADWVMQAGPEFFTRDTTEDVVIETTFDPVIQAAAAAAVNKVFGDRVREGSKAQVAVVVMSADGAVRAMVGGRETTASGGFNRAVQAVRQTGSAFKPFIYATALELGRSPLDTVQDEAFCMAIPGSGRWCPSNYSRRFEGTVTLTEALEQSLNIPAVKISETVGRDLVRQVARDFGLVRGLVDAPSLALGVSESTLLEMTGAYAGILNGGSSVTPYGLRSLRLRGEAEPLMGAGGGVGERVIREESAQQLVWMMRQVVLNGTGARGALPGREVAAKTGTTQAARDAWFIGFTADYVAGVWMGYDDNTPLSGVTGGGLPAEIWRETMQAVHADLPARPLPMLAPTPKPAPAPPPQNAARAERDTAIRSLLRELLGTR